LVYWVCRKIPYIRRNTKTHSSGSALEYTVAAQSWKLKSGFGNHRIIANAAAGKYVQALIPWRRRDLHPEEIGLRIRYTSDGTPSEEGIGCGIVENYYIASISRFSCTLIFEAPVSGTYEIYYMPYVLGEPWYVPKTIYLSADSAKADQTWLDGITNAEFSNADVLRYEARTAFDSFYPMEVPMTEEERTAFLGKAPFVVVAESRLRPVRMKYEIPVLWLERDETSLHALEDTVYKNEHYVFQIAVCQQRCQRCTCTV